MVEVGSEVAAEGLFRLPGLRDAPEALKPHLRRGIAAALREAFSFVDHEGPLETLVLIKVLERAQDAIEIYRATGALARVEQRALIATSLNVASAAEISVRIGGDRGRQIADWTRESLRESMPDAVGEDDAETVRAIFEDALDALIAHHRGDAAAARTSYDKVIRGASAGNIGPFRALRNPMDWGVAAINWGKDSPEIAVETLIATTELLDIARAGTTDDVIVTEPIVSEPADAPRADLNAAFVAALGAYNAAITLPPEDRGPVLADVAAALARIVAEHPGSRLAGLIEARAVPGVDFALLPNPVLPPAAEPNSAPVDPASPSARSAQSQNHTAPLGYQWVQLASRATAAEARAFAAGAGDDARIFRTQNGWHAITGALLFESESLPDVVADRAWPADSLLTRGESFVQELALDPAGPSPTPAFMNTQTLRATDVVWLGRVDGVQTVVDSRPLDAGADVTIWGGPDERGYCLGGGGEGGVVRCADLQAFVGGADPFRSKSAAATGMPPSVPEWGPGIVGGGGLGYAPCGDRQDIGPCLRELGLSAEAARFAVEVGGDMAGFFFADAFHELGVIDLAQATVVGATSHAVPVLLNGSLGAVQIGGSRLPLAASFSDAASRSLLLRHPQATPRSTRILAHRLLADGTQRFVLVESLVDGCMACASVGGAMTFLEAGGTTGGRLARRPIGLVGAEIGEGFDGDRIREGGTGWEGVPFASRPLSLQYRLNMLGYEAGPMDGKPGPQTRAALMAFQDEHCVAPTGQVDAATARALGAADGFSAPCAGTSKPNGAADAPQVATVAPRPAAAEPFDRLGLVPGLYASTADDCTRMDLGEAAGRRVHIDSDGVIERGYERRCTLTEVRVDGDLAQVVAQCDAEGVPEADGWSWRILGTSGFAEMPDGPTFVRCETPAQALADDTATSMTPVVGSHAAPAGSRWLQTHSRADRAEAVAIARGMHARMPEARVFRASNGWYVVVARAVQDAEAGQLARIVRDGALPSDAFLVGGESYVEAVPIASPDAAVVVAEAPDAWPLTRTFDGFADQGIAFRMTVSAIRVAGGIRVRLDTVEGRQVSGASFNPVEDDAAFGLAFFVSAREACDDCRASFTGATAPGISLTPGGLVYDTPGLEILVPNDALAQADEIGISLAGNGLLFLSPDASFRAAEVEDGAQAPVAESEKPGRAGAAPDRLSLAEATAPQVAAMLRAAGVTEENTRLAGAAAEAEVAALAVGYRQAMPTVETPEFPAYAGGHDPASGILRLCVKHELTFSARSFDGAAWGPQPAALRVDLPYIRAFGSMPQICTLSNLSAVAALEALHGTGEMDRFDAAGGWQVGLAVRADPDVARRILDASERGSLRTRYTCGMEFRERQPGTSAPYDHRRIGTCVMAAMELAILDHAAGTTDRIGIRRELDELVAEGVFVREPMPDASGPTAAETAAPPDRAPRSFASDETGEAAVRRIVEGLVGGQAEVVLGYRNAFPFQSEPSKLLAVAVFGALPQGEVATVAGTEMGYGSFALKSWSDLNRFYVADDPAPGLASAMLGRIEDLRILSLREVIGSNCEWSVTYRVWLDDLTPFGTALEATSDADGHTFTACFRTTRSGYDLTSLDRAD